MIVPKLASIIIVNWNGELLLKDCLDSVKGQTYRPFEIIFVDNASTDNSVEIVKDEFHDVKLVVLQENRGFAGGNNAGLRQAVGEYVALVNTDVILDSLWLERVIFAMSSDARIGICASRVMVAGTGCIDSLGEAVTTAGNAYKLRESELWDGVYADTIITGGSAAAILYRHSMLQDIGFYDEDFYLNVEDSDLHARAWLMGWKCSLVSEAIANHKVSASIGKLSDRSIFYLSRNTEWFWLKNFPLFAMVKYFHHKFVYEFLAAVYFCFILKKWRPYLHGKISALMGLPRMFLKRQKIQSQLRLDSFEIDAGLRNVNVFLKTRMRLRSRVLDKKLCP